MSCGRHGGGLGSRSKKLNSSCNPELESTKFDYITDCCINRCLWQFSLQTVIVSRAFYQRMSQAEQENWLAAMTAAWIVWHSGIQQQVVPRLSGLIVCCRAVCFMYGISESKLRACIGKDPNIFRFSAQVGNQNAAKKNNQDLLHTWLTEFFDGLGDLQPDTGKIHMPSRLSKCDIYEAYKLDLQKQQYQSSSIASESTFNKFITIHFSHIIFPKTTRIGKCNFCTPIAARRAKCTSQAEADTIKQEIQAHL